MGGDIEFSGTVSRTYWVRVWPTSENQDKFARFLSPGGWLLEHKIFSFIRADETNAEDVLREVTKYAKQMWPALSVEVMDLASGSVMSTT